MSTFDDRGEPGVAGVDGSVDPLVRLKTWSSWTGGLLAVLGILAIAAPWAAAHVVEVICAGVLIAAGAGQLALATATYSWRGFWLALVCGAVSVLGGVAMLAIPVEGVHALVTFLGLVILFEAAAKFAAAFSLPPDFPRGWLLCDGVVTAALAALLLTARPEQAGVLLGVIVGVNLLTSGIALLAAGFWLRRAVG
jgi:uncharacterized membrane protein HdeD (DUF308 family)